MLYEYNKNILSELQHFHGKNFIRHSFYLKVLNYLTWSEKPIFFRENQGNKLKAYFHRYLNATSADC